MFRLPKRHANCLLLHPLNAVVGILFTITGRMDGGLSLAGRLKIDLIQKFNFYLTMWDMGFS